MSDPGSIAAQSLRAELRDRRHRAIMPRLWHVMRDEWQRVQDRMATPSTKAASPGLHAGVPMTWRPR